MKRAAISASNLQAAALCPGKPNAEAGLAESNSDAAERGTNLHPYFRTTLDRSHLAPNDQNLLRWSDVHAERFLAEFRECAAITPDEPFIEAHEIDMLGIVPGHPDDVILWRAGDIAAVLDFKSGPGHVDDAQDNYQLATYSANVWHRQPFQICGVAIIQPDALGPRMTSAIYTASDMPGVLTEIRKVRDATLPADAPRIPGEVQCKWCKAKASCEEYKAQFEGPLETMDRGLAVSYLSAEKLERLHVAIQFANKIKDEVSGEMRRRVAAGEMPGFKLQSSGDDVTLNDALGFFSDLQETLPSLTAGEFDACRKVIWGELETLVQAKLRVSEKRAKEIIRDVSAPYATRTPKAMKVAREKAARIA